MIVRPVGYRGGPSPERMQQGDTLGGAEVLSTLTTAGDGAITAAALTSGIITRTGPGAGYTDTLPTAADILAAIAGSNSVADVAPGTTFRCMHRNGVAQAMTLAAPASGGVVLGSNVNNAASQVRHWLVTVLNSSPARTVVGTTTNGAATVTLATPIQMGTYDNSDNKGYGTITAGMSVYGTGVAAGATILGITYGQGTITGFTMSANATASGTVSITLTPTVRVDGLFAGAAI